MATTIGTADTCGPDGFAALLQTAAQIKSKGRASPDTGISDAARAAEPTDWQRRAIKEPAIELMYPSPAGVEVSHHPRPKTADYDKQVDRMMARMRERDEAARLEQLWNDCQSLLDGSPKVEDEPSEAAAPAQVLLPATKPTFAAKVALDEPVHVYPRNGHIPKEVWETMTYAQKRAHRNGARTAAAKGKQPVRADQNNALINESLVADAAKQAGEQDYFREEIKELKKQLSGKEAKEAEAAEHAAEQERLLQVSIDHLCSGRMEFREDLTLKRWLLNKPVNYMMSMIGRSDDALVMEWRDGSRQLESAALAGTSPSRKEITRYVDVTLPHSTGPRRMEIHAPIFAECVAAGDYLRDEMAYRSIITRKRGQLPFEYHVGLNRPDLMRDTLELVMIYNDAKSGVLKETWRDQLHFPPATVALTAITCMAIVMMMCCILTVLYVSPTRALRFLIGVSLGTSVELGQFLCLGIYLSLRRLSQMTIQGAWLRVRNTALAVLRPWLMQ